MGSAALKSSVLEGVESIDWMTTSCLCFVGSLAATMRYLGEDVSNDYLMGVSGGAFKTYWLLPWAPSNCDLMMVGEEPARRAFGALGYGYTSISDMERKQPKSFYCDHIVASIDAGKPVLADGVVGPPEVCVVAGYEAGGDVLLGRSYFQEDKSAYFRVENWHANIYGLILVGDKGHRPSAREALRGTLEWALWLARTPEFEGAMEPGVVDRTHANGLAAYDAMARMLRRDEEFVQLDAPAREARLCAIGNDGLFLLPAKREAAARFLETMALEVPGCAADLRAAARHYADEVQTLKDSHPFTPWTGSSAEEIAEKLSAGNRARLADTVCRARQHEERAVECLERAYARLS